MPIGGVAAYKNHISPSGVGYDIACGNLASKTDIKLTDLGKQDLNRIGDEIQKRISFGIGRKNNEPVDASVLDEIAASPIKQQRDLLKLASDQLGTVGSGNHYVDILVDTDSNLWVGVHFGSRGFGHKTATGFMQIAQGGVWGEGRAEGEMDSPPLLLDISKPSGQDYIQAMNIAGNYAYAGRQAVVDKVLEILGTKSIFSVHNHHNFAWKEAHLDAEGNPQDYWVVRKGATPAFPGQMGFVGGSMGDFSVILEGVKSETSRRALYSTVHGAGRVMSRTQARGKVKMVAKWRCQNYRKCNYAAPKGGYHKDENGPTPKCPQCGHKLRLTPMEEQVSPGKIDFPAVKQALLEGGLVLRGAGADEAPEVYRKLEGVLQAHEGTIAIKEILLPKIVVMAGAEVYDPYKD